MTQLATQLDHSSADQLMQLAIGRLFRLLSRPFEAGDYDQYEMCRSAVLDAAEVLGVGQKPDYQPSLSQLARHKAVFGDSGG